MVTARSSLQVETCFFVNGLIEFSYFNNINIMVTIFHGVS